MNTQTIGESVMQEFFKKLGGFGWSVIGALAGLTLLLVAQARTGNLPPWIW